MLPGEFSELFEVRLEKIAFVSEVWGFSEPVTPNIPHRINGATVLQSGPELHSGFPRSVSLWITCLNEWHTSVELESESMIMQSKDRRRPVGGGHCSTPVLSLSLPCPSPPSFSDPMAPPPAVRESDVPAGSTQEATTTLVGSGWVRQCTYVAGVVHFLNNALDGHRRGPRLVIRTLFRPDLTQVSISIEPQGTEGKEEGGQRRIGPGLDRRPRELNPLPTASSHAEPFRTR